MLESQPQPTAPLSETELEEYDRLKQKYNGLTPPEYIDRSLAMTDFEEFGKYEELHERTQAHKQR
ncbi:hypothetical protein KBC79_04760 [Candidatus Woesebacteria bacterium]|nr:hypothetical protein [Candidatus Woesebacteria bacterium]